MTFLIQEVVKEDDKTRGRKSAQQKEAEKNYWEQKRRALKESVQDITLELEHVTEVECKKGIMTVKGYVCGIVDLWEHQRNFEGSLEPHPRTKSVKTFLQRIEIDQHRLKEEGFEDRGKGTMQDLVRSLFVIMLLLSILFREKIADLSRRYHFLLTKNLLLGLLR